VALSSFLFPCRRRFEGRNELERDTELREEFLRIKEA